MGSVIAQGLHVRTGLFEYSAHSTGPQVTTIAHAAYACASSRHTALSQPSFALQPYARALQTCMRCASLVAAEHGAHLLLDSV